MSAGRICLSVLIIMSCYGTANAENYYEQYIHPGPIIYYYQYFSRVLSSLENNHQATSRNPSERFVSILFATNFVKVKPSESVNRK